MKKAGEFDRKLGRNIFRCRIAAGLTRKELAIAIGITQQQLQKYEMGINRISVSRLFDIASILKLPVTKLLELENSSLDENECDNRQLNDIIIHVNRIKDKNKLDAIRNLVKTLSVGDVPAPAMV